MGLSICRAIIEAHEGRLWVSPNVPQGSVFQFTLGGTEPASAGLDPGRVAIGHASVPPPM